MLVGDHCAPLLPLNAGAGGFGVPHGSPGGYDTGFGPQAEIVIGWSVATAKSSNSYSSSVFKNHNNNDVGSGQELPLQRRGVGDNILKRGLNIDHVSFMQATRVRRRLGCYHLLWLFCARDARPKQCADRSRHRSRGHDLFLEQRRRFLVPSRLSVAVRQWSNHGRR